MYTTIQKWGNSQAVRIPKGILEMADLHENDKVEVAADNHQIIISRVAKKHKSIEERLKGYNGNGECKDWDTGITKGKEVW